MFQVERVVSYLKSSVGTHCITDSAYREVLRVGEIKSIGGYEFMGKILIRLVGVEDDGLLIMMRGSDGIIIDKWQDSSLLN